MNAQKSQSRRVTRAIKLALARLAEKNPELARLLRKTIETGTYVSYTPVKLQPAPRKPLSSKKRAPLAREEPIQHQNGIKILRFWFATLPKGDSKW